MHQTGCQQSPLPMRPPLPLPQVGISNTHDLDSRVLPRIASRLASSKLAFQVGIDPGWGVGLRCVAAGQSFKPSVFLDSCSSAWVQGQNKGLYMPFCMMSFVLGPSPGPPSAPTVLLATDVWRNVLS